MKENDLVQHKIYGQGSVVAITSSGIILVRFGDKIESVTENDLEIIESPESQMLKTNDESENRKALARLQGLIIKNINDVWGVFSRSSISLLPHQLWVCKQVLKQWPVRYLVADDVGLGKTVEAGLIISGLIATGKAKRILILTPAKLVEQWRERLHDMFNLNFVPYLSSFEKSKVNFWEANDNVIASFPTVQADKNARHNHIFEAPSWDLIVVDEAHHMNNESHLGMTLQYELFNKMVSHDKIVSTVLFTGTPHHGKNFAFWSLMSLVNPNVFNPKNDENEMYAQLKNYFIRNNKQNVVDMNGEKLFQKTIQHPYTFTYSKEEQDFYDEMTNFILTGQGYAKSLDERQGNSVNLLLTSLQKIAASSVSAIMAALLTRKNTLIKIKNNLANEIDTTDLKADEIDEDDGFVKDLENEIKKQNFILMKNELEHIDNLISVGEKVKEETRIKKIIEIIKNDYPNENILFFTEYKRTQALMIKELMKEFGEDSVTFINGDEALSNVEYPDGSLKNIAVKRNSASEMFNDGKIRFLVSTEAAGEGIDLQKNCHVLIHIDLPWNPMRLHQRVGRINRLGQKNNVDVISIRNKNNIEGKIWLYLENKINEIEKMLIASMEDPDDMMQLVLGMNNNAFYDSLFTESINLKSEEQKTWFDKKTQTFGGESAVNIAKKLGLNAAKFNLAGLKDVPKVDIPDLIPFMKNVFKINEKRMTYDKNSDSFSFAIPDKWRKFGLSVSESNIVFRRTLKNGEKSCNIAGIGYYPVNKAIETALNYKDYVAFISGKNSYFIYTIYDEVTATAERVKNYIFVVEFNSETQSVNLKQNDEFFKMLNKMNYTTENTNHINFIPKIVKDFVDTEKCNLGINNPFAKLECILCGELPIIPLNN